MKPSTAIIHVGLLGALLLSSTPAQQKQPITEDDDIVRVNTTLVTVPVGVMDRHGRFLPDLKEGQFQLFEDGVEQKIAYFDTADEPFTVALMLDTSDSTRFRLEDIKEAAMAFVRQLRPADRVLVASFDRGVTLLAELSNDRNALEGAIRSAQTSRGTGLYNALDIVIGQRLNSIRGRKAILLFTDGVDTGSAGASYESTLRMAEELDALIYSIHYRTEKTPRVAQATAERYLHLLSKKTGGRYYFADTVESLTKTFMAIAQELREQYSLGYYPKNGGQNVERRIKVRVSVTDAVVKARRSYLYKERKFSAP